MKIILFLIIFGFIVIVFFLQYYGSGMKRIQMYEFDTTYSILDTTFESFLNSNLKYKPNGIWNKEASETNKSMYFLKFYYVYFNTNPEEMVVLDRTGDSLDLATSKLCTLSIMASTRYKVKCNCLYFNKVEELSNEELEVLKRKVEKEVFNKLGIKYRRVYNESNW